MRPSRRDAPATPRPQQARSDCDPATLRPQQARSDCDPATPQPRSGCDPATFGENNAWMYYAKNYNYKETGLVIGPFANWADNIFPMSLMSKFILAMSELSEFLTV